MEAVTENETEETNVESTEKVNGFNRLIGELNGAEESQESENRFTETSSLRREDKAERYGRQSCVSRSRGAELFEEKWLKCFQN